MKILYLLKDGPDAMSDGIAEEQSREHLVEIIDLSSKEISYETVIDRIFDCDRVISW